MSQRKSFSVSRRAPAAAMIPRFNYSPPGIAGYNMRESSSLTIPVQHSNGDAVNTSACSGLGESSGELFVAGHMLKYFQ